MIELWHVPQPAALRWHRWGDECVVHYEASNDTYRLSNMAGEVLIELSLRKRATVSELARHAGLDDADAARILEELSDLELAAQC